MIPEPTLDNVIIRMYPADSPKFTIIVPDRSTVDRGEVVSVGPLCKTVKVGYLVGAPPYKALRTDYDGEGDLYTISEADLWFYEQRA